MVQDAGIALRPMGSLDGEWRIERDRGRLHLLRGCASVGRAKAQPQRTRPSASLPSGGSEAWVLYNTAGKLYDTFVATMSVSEARERLSEVVDVAQSEAVVLERYGRPAAVVVSAERYQQLLDALEEAEDVAAFDVAIAEEGSNIPWEQVKADLGWVDNVPN